MVLRITVPLGDSETPASYVSRFAAANGLPAREFCLDWETTFQSIVDGSAQAISIIAGKADLAAGDLMQHAFVKTNKDKHDYAYRGERLQRGWLRRKDVAVCPACLAQDLASTTGRRPRLAAYGRAIWQIAAIKTCPHHHMPLIVAADDLTPGRLHDFADLIAPVLPNISQLAAVSPARSPTDFETYLIERLDKTGASIPFLDRLDLYVAIHCCELVGAVSLHGRTPSLKTLSDEEWRLAGAAGFDILRGGTESLDAFLRELQQTYPYTRSGTEGPQAVFGRVYQVLEFAAPDAAYDPVREAIGSYIRANFPLAAGDVVFGVPTPSRTLHSIRSLSLETGQHPKRLRKILEASGALTPASRLSVDANVLFPVQAAPPALLAGHTTLSRPAASRHINAPRCQIDLLVKSDLIKPVLDGRAAGAVDQYAVPDLDRFLEQLLDGAVRVDSPGPDQLDIPAAGKRACCSAAEIVRLVLDKKLAWTGRSAGARGYLALLVDVAELRPLVQGDDHGGIKPRDVAKLLGVNDQVVYRLIEHGHLPSTSRIHPINRCPQTVVMPADLQAFQRAYVTLFGLAKERGEHFRKTKKAMDDAGVEAVFDPATLGATIYRRSVSDQSFNAT
ncbi:hypothetical protein RPB_2536 [Rhodopseudomonas palustris HaA2]|uniref:TniQ domain-containing protein n=1 Tax=Rhodopseudomonas palustris (strain HaA2) TaxID=316058 RepID=Q2IX20_RHOP2|nr:TniQ family protein [Rhodopseudomonas palustris]ABD07240.1 hypothetical protein RPB_2536 [Rhodopseudomonas palustris HaA2]